MTENITAPATTNPASEPEFAADSHTPGPWQQDWHYIVAPDPAGIHPDIYIAEIAEEDSDGRIASPEQQAANGLLIAAAPELLAACRMVVGRWEQGNLAEAARACHAAVALATGGCPPWDVTDAPVSTIDIDALLAERRQVADIWSIADAQAVRPDLSDDQAWEVLQRAWRKFDAAIGNHWDMLAYHAEELAGPAPDSDEA